MCVSPFGQVWMVILIDHGPRWSQLLYSRGAPFEEVADLLLVDPGWAIVGGAVDATHRRLLTPAQY
jgi:hypothetical protein